MYIVQTRPNRNRPWYTEMEGLSDYKQALRIAKLYRANRRRPTRICKEGFGPIAWITPTGGVTISIAYMEHISKKVQLNAQHEGDHD